jgi:hypothetical protein
VIGVGRDLKKEYKMANIINNHLLALGSKSEIAKLKTLLENHAETIKILSQQIFGIYNPSKTRYPEDKDFGKIPGPFSSDVSVWDIACGKDGGASMDERSFGLHYLFDSEEEAINEADDCLFFCFQSKYSQPEAGFEYLAKEFVELMFKWYCDGEFESPISAKIFDYSNGKLDYQDVEEEDEDDEQDE